ARARGAGRSRRLPRRRAGPFGGDESAIGGRPASTLFDEASWRETPPRLARRELRDEGVESRSTMIGKAGRRFPARVAIKSLRGSAGEGAGFLVVVHDVSDEGRLEEGLEEAEDRYASLVEGRKEGIAILRETRILYANSALADMCGVPVEQLSGKLLREHVATPDVLLLQERLGLLENRPPGEVDRLSLTLVDGRGEARAEVTLV